MKSRFHLTLVMSVAVLLAKAQTEELERFNYSMLSAMSPRVTTINYDEIKGTPYSSDEFIEGTIYFISGSKKDVPMRYDWYSKTMEVEYEGKTFEISNTTTVNYVLLDGKKYVPFKHIRSINNYLIELYRGNYSLFRREDVRYIEGAPAQSGYDQPSPPKFEWYKPEYLIITNEGKTILPELNKKDFPLQFPGHEKEIQDYIKENGLNPKNEEDLTRLIKMIDSLVPSVE